MRPCSALGARHRRRRRPVARRARSARASTALGRHSTLGLASRLASYRRGPPVSDEVGALQQRGLALAHLPRRVLERRQLVHAVVDHGARRQLAEQRQRHRRVEPDQVVVDAVLGEVGADQRLQRRELIVVKAARPRRRVRPQHLDAGARRHALETGRPARVHGSSTTTTGKCRASRESRCWGRWKTNSQRRWEKTIRCGMGRSGSQVKRTGAEPCAAPQEPGLGRSKASARGRVGAARALGAAPAGVPDAGRRPPCDSRQFSRGALGEEARQGVVERGHQGGALAGEDTVARPRRDLAEVGARGNAAASTSRSRPARPRAPRARPS